MHFSWQFWLYTPPQDCPQAPCPGGLKIHSGWVHAKPPFQSSAWLRSAREQPEAHLRDHLKSKEKSEMTHHSVHSHFLQKRLEVGRKQLQKLYLELSFWEREESRHVSLHVGMNEREKARESEWNRLKSTVLGLYTHLTTDRGKYKHGKKEGMCQKQEVRVKKHCCSKRRWEKGRARASEMVLLLSYSWQPQTHCAYLKVRWWIPCRLKLFQIRECEWGPFRKNPGTKI